ncbi:DUF4334 domain-containing protein [Brevibacterium daeguense]|nr:DUF4334 domain-containing protein [Brevibacterium daeguense]
MITETITTSGAEHSGTVTAELRRGMSTAQALAVFDSLPAVRVEEMFGRWTGSEVPTGSPLDGLLGAYGWHGKRFASAEEVDPLIFEKPGSKKAGAEKPGSKKSGSKKAGAETPGLGKPGSRKPAPGKRVLRRSGPRRRGSLFAVEPAVIPLQLALRLPSLVHHPATAALGRLALPLIRTRRPKARLRMVEYRGVSTATMIYDAQPINDHFRRLDNRTLLGAMDLRGLDSPFFFLLHREPDTLS